MNISRRSFVKFTIFLGFYTLFLNNISGDVPIDRLNIDNTHLNRNEVGFLKIATFNLKNNYLEHYNNGWIQRIESAIELIKEHDLDLIGTQELTEESKLYLMHNLSNYDIIGDSRGSFSISDEYNSILVRKGRFKLESLGKTYALSNTIDIKGSKFPLDFFPRIATTIHLSKDNCKYLVVNTHLDNVLEYNRNLQLEALSKIMTFEKTPDERIIVMGDFNTNTNERIQTFMKKNDLKEAALPSLESSYRLTRMKYPIDHIFLSKGIEIEDTYLIKNKYNGIYPSDHYPVKVLIKTNQ